MNLPLGPDTRVVELGGGDRPMFHPNVDCRPGPQIDIVADLNQELPLPSESYDLVVCKFALEHISWRRVPLFLRETWRILVPGGTGFFITANTYEQCRKLAANPDWNDDLVCMLFGGQNVDGVPWETSWMPEAHHTGFSPRSAERLCRTAGYMAVEIQPLPECDTDMSIVARKGRAVVQQGWPNA